mmetsp:Transcript_124079/g.264560  ORF Transcript_124079/g.264560 Transcript_124079/m.264560 type:complete len:241 (+) Transcript_124079:475-1197(+)
MEERLLPCEWHPQQSPLLLHRCRHGDARLFGPPPRLLFLLIRLFFLRTWKPWVLRRLLARFQCTPCRCHLQGLECLLCRLATRLLFSVPLLPPLWAPRLHDPVPLLDAVQAPAPQGFHDVGLRSGLLVHHRYVEGVGEVLVPHSRIHLLRGLLPLRARGDRELDADDDDRPIFFHDVEVPSVQVHARALLALGNGQGVGLARDEDVLGAPLVFPLRRLRWEEAPVPLLLDAEDLESQRGK